MKLRTERTAAQARATPKTAPSQERTSCESSEMMALLSDDIVVVVVWFLTLGYVSDARLAVNFATPMQVNFTFTNQAVQMRLFDIEDWIG